MPGAPLTAAPAIGWFGKLPCAGDFVHRRLPYPVMEAVDNWLQQGLGQLRTTHAADWRACYEAAPMWNCAIPATITRGGQTLIGLLAPSRDRVGREFPLCAGVALPAGISATPLLATSHDWLMALGRIVALAQTRPTTIDAFDAAVQSITMPLLAPADPAGGGGDDILAIINDSSADVPTVPMPLAHALPWPDLPHKFDPDGTTSYWWTNTGTGAPLRGFATDAGLAPSLMLTLMRPLVGAPRGRR